MLIQGNEAVGWGALAAGCDAFFGYPITPQNEIPEWFAREFPKRGKVFLQTQSELGSVYMLMGAGASGVRAMTSTSSPGWALMQDGMSCMANAEVPGVIVLVQRGGPGMGHVRQAQVDYLSVTRGGGNGGYRNIVLAPHTVEETHDLVQLAFFLADKYRNPVIVLTDALMGQIAESMEVKTLDFGPLPDKDWALEGRANREDGRARMLMCSNGNFDYIGFLEVLDNKFKSWQEQEVRYELYHADQAQVCLVAYGYCARVAKAAVDWAREEGHNLGLIRPISLYPFPQQVIRDKAEQGCKFLVVEDSMGQMLEDVEIAVQGRAPVSFVGAKFRHQRDDGGKIYPDKVIEELNKLF